MTDPFADAFSFYDPSVETKISRRRLPHWEQAGAAYFITFRTFDSLPATVLNRWNEERALWLAAHGIKAAAIDWQGHFEALPEKQRREFHDRFNRSWHAMLDAGHGECLLRRAEIAKIVTANLLHFDGHRYAMGDFIIMPNHVHLLVWFPANSTRMKKQCQAWKRYTAMEINRALIRNGHFWQGESYDHLVRSTAQWRHYREYIAENPEKARLRAEHFHHYVSTRWAPRPDDVGE